MISIGDTKITHPLALLLATPAMIFAMLAVVAVLIVVVIPAMILATPAFLVQKAIDYARSG